MADYKISYIGDNQLGNVCPTAHCERYKPHFDFGDIPSPIVPHRNKPQTQGGMTAH